MIEQLLRETFTAHETLAPAPEQVRARIAAAARRRRWRRRTIGGTAVALLALIAVTLVHPDALRRPGLLGRPGVVGGPGYLSSPGAVTGPVTFLLVGTDQGFARGTPGPRADAIVLAHLPAGGGAAYLISIPRTAPGDVFATGGMPALREEVTRLTGIPIDGAGEVEFAGLVAVVDAMGGVDLCVERRMYSDHRPGVIYEPGCRRFGGVEAMDFLRQRKSLPDGDLGRQRHARQFLAAVYSKVAGADLATIVALIRAAGDHMRMDLNGLPLADLYGQVRHLSPDDVVGIEPPATVDGLTPAAQDLWTAVRDGTLPQWVAANPDRVS